MTRLAAIAFFLLSLGCVSYERRADGGVDDDAGPGDAADASVVTDAGPSDPGADAGPDPQTFAPRTKTLGLGRDHACAIGSGGLVYCWGNNDLGQLGDGTRTSRNRPGAPVLGVSDAVMVASREELTCALTSAGQVYCWGDETHWSFTVTFEPYVLFMYEPAIDLAVGDREVCVRAKSTGDTICYGPETRLRYMGGARGAVDVASGEGDKSCAVTTWDWPPQLVVECWTGDRYAEPVPVQHAVGLAVGNLATYVTTSKGKLFAISDSGTDELASSGVQSVAASQSACAVVPGAGVACWDESRVRSDVGLDATEVAVGQSAAGKYVCARDQSGAIWCWGANDRGRLGIGSDGSVDVPTPVAW